eukprot:243330-Amphidinium_carterae.1
MEGRSSKDVDASMKFLETLKRLQGGKKGNWNPRSKTGLKTASDKGSGRSSTGPEGWPCPSCKFYNFSHRAVCLSCKASKGAGQREKQEQQRCEQGHAQQATPPKASAEAKKDKPELKEHLEAALAAVIAKRTNALPFKDQRAKLLAQAKAIATKWIRRPN